MSNKPTSAIPASLEERLAHVITIAQENCDAYGLPSLQREIDSPDIQNWLDRLRKQGRAQSPHAIGRGHSCFNNHGDLIPHSGKR